MENPTLTLDGREFESALNGLTAAQDNYVVGHLRAAGVTDLFVQGNELTLDEKRVELLTRLLVSGRATNILAGLLTERGRKWKRAEADRNAARFDDITDLEEKNRMRALLSGSVLGFFPLGEPSSTNSPSSSNQSGKDRDSASAEASSLGDFGPIIREVADWNPERFDAILAWPLRDLFLAYVQRMKREARRGYEVELLVWAVLNPHRKKPVKAPELPSILRR